MTIYICRSVDRTFSEPRHFLCWCHSFSTAYVRNSLSAALSLLLLSLGLYLHSLSPFSLWPFSFSAPWLRPCLVGITGFEPVTPCSQSRCANRTAPHPEVVRNQFPNRFRCAKIHAFLVITNFSARKIVLPVGCRRAVRNRLSSSAPFSCRTKPRPETVQRWKRIVKRRIRRVTKSGM